MEGWEVEEEEVLVAELKKGVHELEVLGLESGVERWEVGNGCVRSGVADIIDTDPGRD